MARADVLAHLYAEWGIQALVLLSFTLQVTLLITAEIRRRKDSGVLKAVVWSAYLLADWTAIYALGHMSVTRRSPEHQLMAFWAPFLLLHLGGQDSITAYAIEDNQLWLRHLQALAVQVAAAAYILYEFSNVGSDGLLRRAAILMYVVGVLKYGERVWALRCASALKVGNKLMGNYKEIDRMGNDDGRTLKVSRDWQNTVSLLWTAHWLFNVPNKILELPLDISLTEYYRWSDPVSGERLFTVVEMQMSLMHDLFYTKAKVMHTRYGLCVRIISSASAATTLVLFRRSRHPYDRVDVAITYVLLIGAAILETTSLVRTICSSWLWWVEPIWFNWRLDREEWRWWMYFFRFRLPEKQFDLFCNVVGLGQGLWGRKRWWSDSMGQHNLFELYDRRKTSRSSKIARRMGMEEWWNTVAHSRHIPVSPKVKHLLVEMLSKLVMERRLDMVKEVTYKAMGMLDSEMEVGKTILVWHIATNVYLRWYKDHQQQAKNQKERLEAIEALSNYMLFLLVARPYMLPDAPNRQEYSEVCLHFGIASDISAEDFVRSLHSIDRSTPERLQIASHLGLRLIDELGLVGMTHADRLELIAEVWVWILFHVSSGCSAYHHAKQLSSGGELLTWTALLAGHVCTNANWRDTWRGTNDSD